MRLTPRAAYVFTRNGVTWSQQAKLTASDSSPGDWFGSSVAISSNRVIIGAGNSNRTGASYVFTRSGTTWSQQQKLTASGAATDDQFGFSVALSAEAVVVGAPGKNSNSGMAYVTY